MDEVEETLVLNSFDEVEASEGCVSWIILNHCKIQRRLIKAMNQTVGLPCFIHLQMFMSSFSLWAADSPGGGVETIRVSCSPGHGLSKTVNDTFIWRFVHKIWRSGDLTAAAYSTSEYEWNVSLFAESLRCTNSKTRILCFFERAKQTDRRQFAPASHIWKSILVFNPLSKSVNFSCVNKLIRNKKPLSINILFHSHVLFTELRLQAH